MASLLIDAIKGVGTVIAVLALILIFPFVMMWFFRWISIGTSKAPQTLRKIR